MSTQVVLLCLNCLQNVDITVFIPEGYIVDFWTERPRDAAIEREVRSTLVAFWSLIFCTKILELGVSDLIEMLSCQLHSSNISELFFNSTEL